MYSLGMRVVSEIQKILNESGCKLNVYFKNSLN